MATERGWWTLDINIPRESLSEVDWEHIGDMVKEGFTSGEIVQDEEEDE
jgi:hypothetical protein